LVYLVYSVYLVCWMARHSR